MGREVRMVPPNWDHPRYTKDDAPQERLIGEYIPQFDEEFATAKKRWLDGLRDWEAGVSEDFKKLGDKYEYWEWEGNPPNRNEYRSYKDSEATWYQAYQTVSEGTPVSPPFATKEELIQYLAVYGDFWDQIDHGEVWLTQRKGGWGYENAKKFVEQEYAPSLITDGQGGVFGPSQLADMEKSTKK